MTTSRGWGLELKHPLRKLLGKWQAKTGPIYTSTGLSNYSKCGDFLRLMHPRARATISSLDCSGQILIFNSLPFTGTPAGLGATSLLLPPPNSLDEFLSVAHSPAGRGWECPGC